MPHRSAPPAPAGGCSPDAAQLQRLLQLALPDRHCSKAAGWWEQTDFLLTRSHVDGDGDVFLDGLLLTVWKQWDFWLALPDSAAGLRGGGWLARAGAWLRAAHAPKSAQGLARQYRAFDAHGAPGPWQLLDAASAPAAWADFLQAWNELLVYWDDAEDERQHGRPLRAALHAALTAEQVAALVALPLFTEHYNDWTDPERAGLWLGDVWVGGHTGGAQGSVRHPAALKLSWRNGSEMRGDPEDDAHASYQIELLPPGSPPPAGTAHPAGLAVTYRQRQGDGRQPLPAHATAHLRRLAQLFAQVQASLQALDASEQPPQDEAVLISAGAPSLGRLPPYSAHLPDAEALGAGVLALSQAWQEAARAHAAALRAQWLGDAPKSTSSPARDARPRQAGAALQLMLHAQHLGDPGLAERLHHRFPFAPTVYAAHAGRHGRPVVALAWRPDGGLYVEIQADGGTQHWHIRAQDGQCEVQLADSADAPPAMPHRPSSSSSCLAPAVTSPGTDATRASRHGVDIRGDEQGDLHGVGEDGTPLWRHHLGGAVLCLAFAPQDADLLAVGTAAGYLVLLRHARAPLAHQPSTSRWQELRRVLFWDDLLAPLPW